MLKVARYILSIPFSDICNTSFIGGISPEKNKVAEVIPSHKKECTNDVNNYRPISLLDLHKIIYSNQSGLDLDIQLLIP